MEKAIYCGNIYSWINICDKVKGDVIRLNSQSVLEWVNKHGKDSYLIFGTDVIPFTIFNYPESPIEKTPIFEYMNRGGRVIWAGDVPFFYIEKGGDKVISKETAVIFGHVDYFIDKAVFTSVENSIVGELLGYRPVESFRPIHASRELIPISYHVEEDKIFYSSWIKMIGNNGGAFVRVYDTKYVDVDYLLSLPERLENLGEGIRILNFKKFDKKIDIKLPKFKVLVIIGDNNVGKTTILEALSFLSSIDQLDKIAKYRNTSLQEVLDLIKRNTRIEAFLNGKYALRRWNAQWGNMDLQLILPRVSEDLEKMNISVEQLREISKRVKDNIDSKIHYIYLTVEGQEKKKVLRVLFEDLSDIRLDDLGQGYRSLIYFFLHYFTKPYDVVMIDDMEAFAMHPELLKKVIKILLGSESKFIITTQSMDIEYYIADVAVEEKKSDMVYYLLLKNDGSYEIYNADEALKEMDFIDLRYKAIQREVRSD
ncbi:MAG: AAA family ATPase [Sulfolobaceae archaeon]|nr:AAA family ATPase [Sulfolobaceae archaeon]